jgi:hypothetical protein
MPQLIDASGDVVEKSLGAGGERQTLERERRRQRRSLRPPAPVREGGREGEDGRRCLPTPWEEEGATAPWEQGAAAPCEEDKGCWRWGHCGGTRGGARGEWIRGEEEKRKRGGEKGKEERKKRKEGRKREEEKKKRGGEKGEEKK